MNRLRARLSTLSAPATGLVSQPEPRTIGSFARGRQISAGNFLFAGYLVEAPDTAIWDLPMPDLSFEQELHGFTWVDDLAAVSDGAANLRMRNWTHAWVTRYGRGTGPGWTPDLTGRRLIRWIHHAMVLLNGADKATSDAFYRSLAQQTNFLSHRWSAASPGLARFEALTGLIYAGIALTGMEKHIAPAVKALGRECTSQIDEQGGIPTRNPEELMEVFTLLSWAAAGLRETDRVPGAAHLAALARIAPSLRALRHSDGGLARFHGGGRGAEGRLDHALAASEVKGAKRAGLAMGFARLSHGRTTMIVDVSPPPVREASAQGHASTLAFELTSGRRPLIVNCGSGRTFGEKWRRAGRATPSHSTLAIEGYSSARLGVSGLMSGENAELLVDAPRDVRMETRESDLANGLIAGHDGYLATHGLTHVRQLYLSNDGRGVRGEDVLATVEKSDERQFDRALDRSALKGIPFKVRFHLHADVDGELDMGGAAVSMALKSGEIWVFRHSGDAKLTLEPSVYLERGRLAPRATKQIVLSAIAVDYATRLSWTLAKAQDTPDTIRDLEREDLALQAR
ncbi:heparinase II/III family protein [Oceaniglobus ichthyenteri]|uniref:heparinase II/III family protein n=1 Tax=Oceaniglobus ichthyenteri TaxID=2136177 RepID=UPI000D3A1D6C|nr:heparinase II/III family protein [Oceaniglobus ichthyenteri]